MAFTWGVNVHQRPWNQLSGGQEVDLAKAIGLTSLRVDIFEPTYIDWFRSLLSEANSNGISVMPVVPVNLSKSTDPAAAYAWGKQTGSMLAAEFRGLTWEAGNEMDEFAIRPGTSGESASDYDNARFNITASAIKGLEDGIRQADPTAQVAVGITGDHFAFLQRLAADGVSWDITTEHYYAGHGDTIIRQQLSDVFGQLSQFGAPILLTEFNQVDGSLLSAAEEASTLVTMMSTINDLAPAYDVFGGYIYELADEPPLVGGEAHYGLANETGNLNPAGLAVQRYLDGPGGLPPSTVPTHAIPVGEIPGEVFRLYETTLGREPDAAGFNFWIGQMNNGMSLQTVEGHLVASPEFQATNTGKLDDSQFVTQLCDQALHRAPEPAELNYWIQSLASGTPRDAVTLAFSESAEAKATNQPLLEAFEQTLGPPK